MYFLLGYFATNSVVLIVAFFAYVLGGFDPNEDYGESAKEFYILFVRAIVYVSTAALIAGLALAIFNY